jgi:hypothetical protein
MEGINIAGAALLFFLAGVITKIVDMVKSRLPQSILMNEYFSAIFFPLLAVGIGMAFAFGIEPLKAFSMLGIEGVAWWLDKIMAGVIMGLGGSIIWDALDTDSRPDVV